jgi:hypothetical protein
MPRERHTVTHLQQPSHAGVFMQRHARSIKILAYALLTALAGVAWAPDASSVPKTVCTITINSADEKDAFRRYLPADKFQFIELVERGRPDWLASACSTGVRCDALVISGHYDGGHVFFSERVDSEEFLPVDEMERASCSDSCSGLFSQLKEVYLFGCNTLNPAAFHSTSEAIARTLAQSGHSPADAERLARALSVRYADSSRDRMRHIFKDVPAIYGFSSSAPLGPAAATLLDHYFQSGGTRDIAGGRAGPRILSYFAGHSLTMTRGSTDADSDAGFRRDVCQFFDDRMSTEQKLDFVRRLLNRDMAEVHMFLDRLENYAASWIDTARQTPAAARAFDEITNDRPARDRYLDFARNSGQPAVRARMIALAQRLGWLTAPEKHVELVRLLNDQLTRADVGSADVELVCMLNREHQLDDTLAALQTATESGMGRAGILACLGSPDGRAQILQALTSPRDADVQIAQVYLRHHPITDMNELQDLVSGIAGMPDSDTQVRALNALANHRLADRGSLEVLTNLFPMAGSINVQRAIAGVLIRADYDQIAKPELLHALREYRLKSPDGPDLIDVLIRRLQVS